MHIFDIKDSIVESTRLEGKEQKKKIGRDIEIEMANLASDGLASSGLALSRISEICLNYDKYMIEFSFDRIKHYIDLNNIPYYKTMDNDIKELLETFNKEHSEYAIGLFEKRNALFRSVEPFSKQLRKLISDEFISVLHLKDDFITQQEMSHKKNKFLNNISLKSLQV